MTLPTQPLGPAGLAQVTRICLGCMGLSGTWDPNGITDESRRNAIKSFETALEVGINFFDHADFYGAFTCETVFKDCLAAVPGIRERIFIATKVGIVFPKGRYDHTTDYVRRGIASSLGRLGVDYVDLYQLHRPDPLTHPSETAKVLDALVDEGLVRQIGVSNYYPHQVLALKRYLRAPIVSNQISLSLNRLDPIYEGAAGGNGDGVLDQCMELDITPLAYSPVGAGWLTGKRVIPEDHPKRDILERILAAMSELSPAYGGATPGQFALAWLLKHPSGVIPILGSNNPEHIQEAVAAVNIDLSREDWYKLWVAARGTPVP